MKDKLINFNLENIENFVDESYSSAEEIKNESEDKTVNFDEREKIWNVNDRIVEIFERSVNSDIELKKKYGILLIKILAAQLLILNGIFILSGLGILKFSNTAFNLYTSAGLVEILISINIVVKYLFNNNYLSEALNKILDNNKKRYNNKRKISKNNELKK